MEDKEKKDAIEKINEILMETSHNNQSECCNFGGGISVKWDEIDNIIRRSDELLTNLTHGGICEECSKNNQNDCEDCDLGLKKKELYRVFKIIKGDWSPDHE